MNKAPKPTKNEKKALSGALGGKAVRRCPVCNRMRQKAFKYCNRCQLEYDKFGIEHEILFPANLDWPPDVKV